MSEKLLSDVAAYLGCDVARVETIFKAEKQGLCFALPVPIGERVYRVLSYPPYECVKQKTREAATHVVAGRFKIEDIEQFGKSIFQTREEAEAVRQMIGNSFLFSRRNRPW